MLLSGVIHAQVEKNRGNRSGGEMKSGGLPKVRRLSHQAGGKEGDLLEAQLHKRW